jgi:hypothetical protein
VLSDFAFEPGVLGLRLLFGQSLDGGLAQITGWHGLYLRHDRPAANVAATRFC